MPPSVKKFLIPMIGLLITSCASTPRSNQASPEPFQIGEVSPGRYVLVYTDTSKKSSADSESTWHRRAAELCGDKAHEVSMLQSVSEIWEMPGSDMEVTQVSGMVRCE